MPKFSIVSVVSRPDIFESCLLASINEQRGKHDLEIIPIYNETNRYSASSALNLGLDVATADVIVLVHQDVRLLYDWFTKLDELIQSLPALWGVLGAAGIGLTYSCADIGKWGGALRTDTVAVGSVWDTDEALTQVPYWDGTKESTQVHCVDECVLVINRRTGLRFDLHFTGFHFYGVDICLQARAAGYSVWAAYLPIIHYGKYSASFTGDKKYWLYLRLLHNKWRMRFPELLGTHFHWTHQERRDFFGTLELIPELTSYIDVALDSDDGVRVELKAMGLKKVQLQTDRQQGLIDI